MAVRVELVEQDITTLRVDAIVNAANESLRGGGGVDGAIHRAAGPKLLQECSKYGGCPTGDAVLTGGYELAAKYVIHTVGPVWRGGGEGESELLASCYRKSLQIARAHRLASVAFPAISCGVYGYPIEQASTIAVQTIMAEIAGDDLPRRVYLVCFDVTISRAYRRALAAFN